jgi:hypothetical protein
VFEAGEVEGVLVGSVFEESKVKISNLACEVLKG